MNLHDFVTHKYNSEEIPKASTKFGQEVISLEQVIYMLKM